MLGGNDIDKNPDYAFDSRRRLGSEGYQDSKWILLDYGSIVVHLFDEASRDYYRLEDLWGGAKRVNWKS